MNKMASWLKGVLKMVKIANEFKATLSSSENR